MHIHLVSFNVPYPPDYGGVIDVFYKIKALQNAGVHVHLHCFDYGRNKSGELLKYCSSVNYYSRKLTLYKQFSTIPFIVGTRNNKDLIQNLINDDYPIILEGLHCTFPMLSDQLKSRKIIVRTHNIEHDYYLGLAKSERNLFKKIYFHIEAKKLELFEPILEKASGIAAISKSDYNYFNKVNPNTTLITPFHPFNQVNSIAGKGKYVLIQGDLSVPENIQSVVWLINNVTTKSAYPFIVAGKNPDIQIINCTYGLKNIQLVANPSNEEMTELVRNSHINLIHSFYPQGFKLKLLKGKTCLSSLPESK